MKQLPRHPVQPIPTFSVPCRNFANSFIRYDWLNFESNFINFGIGILFHHLPWFLHFAHDLSLHELRSGSSCLMKLRHLLAFLKCFPAALNEFVWSFCLACSWALPRTFAAWKRRPGSGHFPCICPTSSPVEPKNWTADFIRAFVRTSNTGVIEFFMDIACTCLSTFAHPGDYWRLRPKGRHIFRWRAVLGWLVSNGIPYVNVA